MTGRNASVAQGWSLEDILELDYPFRVHADPDDGGYVIVFPDLPGCMTQVDTLDELPAMVEDARRLWLEVAYDEGMEIPLPSSEPEYSGRFNVRLPKTLHRQLVEGAERDAVSLNQYVVMLLSQGHATVMLRHTRRINRPDLRGHDRGSSYRMDLSSFSTSPAATGSDVVSPSKPRLLRPLAA